MALEIGDKAKVRADLEVGQDYHGYGIAKEMVELCGKTCTIVGVCNNGFTDLYTIKEDDKEFFWVEEMFEPATDIDVPTKDAQKSVTKFQPKTGGSVTKFQIGDIVEIIPSGTIGTIICVVTENWVTVKTQYGLFSCKTDDIKLRKKEAKKDKMDYTENIKAIMQRQHDKGLKKYGETLEDNTSLNMVQRIEHLQEELIDGLQYCEHIKAISNDDFKANDFQRAVLRTAGSDKSKYLDNAIMGLAGEVGECADIVKKHHFQGHEFDREHFAEELGDVLWYASLAATAIDMPLDEVMKKNIEKLKKRYPEGFDKARSINRKE